MSFPNKCKCLNSFEIDVDPFYFNFSQRYFNFDNNKKEDERIVYQMELNYNVVCHLNRYDRHQISFQVIEIEKGGRKLDFYDPSFGFCLRISLKDSLRQELATESFKPNTSFQIPIHFTLPTINEYLLQNKSTLKKGSALKLGIIAFYNMPPSQNLHEQSFQDESNKKQFENLRNVYKDLLTNSQFSDLTIKTSDQKQLKAHKLILRAQSEYFDRMFTHDMKENLNDEIVIKDFDSTVMQTLLRFIYCGEIEEKDANSFELYAAAHRYEIKNLPELCLISIQKNLNQSNAFKIIGYAHVYDLHHLFDLCIEHLKP